MQTAEEPPHQPEPPLVRALRLGRALVVGSGATLADFSVFTTCVRAAGITPSAARVPALLVGAVVQFSRPGARHRLGSAGVRELRRHVPGVRGLRVSDAAPGDLSLTPLSAALPAHSAGKVGEVLTTISEMPSVPGSFGRVSVRSSSGAPSHSG
jgi:hypothetical protein